MIRLVIIGTGLHVTVGLGFGQGIVQEIPPEERIRGVEVVEIRRKVDRAGRMIQKTGEEAFVEFRKPGSEWNTFRHAIFVIDANEGHENEGFFVVYPNAEYVGRGAIDMATVNGGPYARKTLKKAKKGKEKIGLCFMMEETAPVAHASTVAVSPDGRTYVVAAGERNFAQERLFVKELVEAACAVIKDVGLQKAKDIFGEKGSVFRFRDSYIYIYDTDGTLIFDPGNPQLEGKKISDLGRFDPYAYDLHLETALEKYLAGSTEKLSDYDMKRWFAYLREHGRAWVIFKMYRPGEKILSLKAALEKPVESGGKTYGVGTGFYLVEPGNTGNRKGDKGARP